MNNKEAFLLTAFLTTTVFMAGHFASANKDGNGERPVAASTGEVFMKECQVTGTLIRKEDGIYAVFCASNDTAISKSLSFNYAVACTPPMSTFSRMMPVPKEIHRGCVALTADAGKNSEHEILVQKAPEVVQKAEATESIPLETLSRSLPGSQEIWTLRVSLDDIPASPAGGLALIVTAGGKNMQGKGVTVLARTRPEPPKAQS